MNIIIWDLEVFKYDFLFGAIIVANDSQQMFQSWDRSEIKRFFYTHQYDSIWCGWNSKYYDNIVLDSIINDRDPYQTSNEIIRNNSNVKSKLEFYSYDIMNTGMKKGCSLKLTELISGKSIDTTEVDFNIDRQLTQEEKELTEKYNRSDLNQTLYNFKMFYDTFQLRLEIIKEFNLDLSRCLDMTGAQIAAEVLQAKKDPSLAYKKVKPVLYPNLQIENETVKQFFLNEDFRKPNRSETIKIGNAELLLAAGGIHQAIKKCFYKRLLYLDVSGYYNLVMLNFDLLSRAIPKSGKEIYRYMYDQQIALKKIDPDGPKRKAYKTILLSVFGAQGNQGSAMFDEQIGTLVPITGELFLIDLLEKIHHLCTIVQSNTDGIMIEPNSEDAEKEILSILDEWLKRTGFIIKPKIIYNLWQRDVNNYIYTDSEGNIDVKGEVVKNYDISDKAYKMCDIFDSKEAAIIALGVVNCLAHDITPEETVEQNRTNLRMFQYACKKNTYDYLTYETEKILDYPTVEKLSSPICRVFAWNDPDNIGMIYKHKKSNGKESKAKVASLPDSVFIYNKEILTNEAYNAIKDKIDYDYYIKRIYERIGEFIQ